MGNMYLKTKKLAVLIIAAVVLLFIIFSGAASADGIAPSEMLNDEYPVSFYMKYGDIYKLNDTPTNVSDVKKQYGYKSAYAIRNLSELQGIETGSNIYILTQDIYCIMPTDLAVISEFTGTLIGNGHTIYNLTINGNTKKLGLVGTLGTSGTLNYVNLMCANISSGSNYVGGLVGFANSMSNITGCMVMHSDVTGVDDSDHVGGLVGYANSMGLNILNCSVENSSISSGSYYVGGLVGYAGSTSIVSSDVKNCTVSGDENVGGLIGGAHSSDVDVEMCKVVNSMICAGSEAVGGLVGYAEDASVVSCDVKNCTVSGSDGVGGLIGPAGSASFTECAAEDCLVAGTNTSVKQLAGEGDATGMSADNVIVDNMTTAIQINLTRVGGYPSEYHLVDSKLKPAVDTPQTFFKTLVFEKSYGYAYKSYVNTSSDVYFTNLGAYGTANGFGYYPTYTVTYNGNGNESGSVPVDTTWYIANATVTVKENTGNLARTGYLFNGWNIGSTSGDLVRDGETFTITIETTLYANWTLSPYIEVNTWAGLNKSIAEWTDADEARTVVVTASIMDRVVGNNTDGIEVKGKIILMTNASPVGNEVVINGNGEGRLFHVLNGGNLTLCGNSTNSATLNLTGGNTSALSNPFGGAVYVESGNLTLNTGAMIINCSAMTSTGGGVYVSEGGTFTMNGGSISDCKTKNNGGGIINWGTFTLTGGSITNCTAKSGGGVYVGLGRFTMTGGKIIGCTAMDTENQYAAGGVFVPGGMFFVKGDANITGNYRNGITSNVAVECDSLTLTLNGVFSGSIGITPINVALVYAGDQFGIAGEKAEGADHFFADANANLVGIISGDKLVWKDSTSSSSYSGSSKQTGYTQIVPTTTSTVTSTAVSTKAPVTPTTKSTTLPKTQSTQSSPVPVAGLIAGLAAAIVILTRLRK